MSKRELAKLAREIKQIKSQLSKTAVTNKGDVYLAYTMNPKLELWMKNVTPEKAAKEILKADSRGDFGDISVELIFIPYDGGSARMFTDKWEFIEDNPRWRF